MATSCLLSVHQKLFWIILYHPFKNLLTVPFCVVVSEAELFVKRTDDVSQVWGHSQKARNFFEALLEKLSQVLVDGFGYPLIQTFRRCCMQSCSLTVPLMYSTSIRRTFCAALHVSVVMVTPSPSLSMLILSGSGINGPCSPVPMSKNVCFPG